MCRLKHNPERQQPVLHASADVVGDTAIRRHLEGLNAEVRLRSTLSVPAPPCFHHSSTHQAFEVSVLNSINNDLIKSPGG